MCPLFSSILNSSSPSLSGVVDKVLSSLSMLRSSNDPSGGEALCLWVVLQLLSVSALRGPCTLDAEHIKKRLTFFTELMDWLSREYFTSAHKKEDEVHQQGEENCVRAMLEQARGLLAGVHVAALSASSLVGIRFGSHATIITAALKHAIVRSLLVANVPGGAKGATIWNSCWSLFDQELRRETQEDTTDISLDGGGRQMLFECVRYALSSPPLEETLAFGGESTSSTVGGGALKITTGEPSLASPAGTSSSTNLLRDALSQLPTASTEGLNAYHLPPSEEAMKRIHAVLAWQLYRNVAAVPDEAPPVPGVASGGEKQLRFLSQNFVLSKSLLHFAKGMCGSDVLPVLPTRAHSSLDKDCNRTFMFNRTRWPEHLHNSLETHQFALPASEGAAGDDLISDRSRDPTDIPLGGLPFAAPPRIPTVLQQAVFEPATEQLRSKGMLLHRRISWCVDLTAMLVLLDNAVLVWVDTFQAITLCELVSREARLSRAQEASMTVDELWELLSSASQQGGGSTGPPHSAAEIIPLSAGWRGKLQSKFQSLVDLGILKPSTPNGKVSLASPQREDNSRTARTLQPIVAAEAMVKASKPFSSHALGGPLGSTRKGGSAVDSLDKTLQLKVESKLMSYLKKERSPSSLAQLETVVRSEAVSSGQSPATAVIKLALQSLVSRQYVERLSDGSYQYLA